MSKKKIIILAVVIVLIGLGIWIYYSINNSGQGNGSGGLNSLFPFSGPNTNNGNGGTGLEKQKNNTSQGIATLITQPVYNPLIQISKKPNTGMTVIIPDQFYVKPSTATSSATSTATTSILSQTNMPPVPSIPTIRFMEKGTGYVYDVDARANNETQKTTTNIVKVTETYFGDNGNSIILRYLKNDNSTIITFLGKILYPAVDKPGVYGTINGDFLSENISNLVMNPDGSNFTYLISTDNGTQGINLSTEKTNKTELFNSHFDEWLLDLTSGGLMATTKPSSDIPGYAYLIQPNGTFQRVLGKVNGLTTKLNPKGDSVLYSESFGSTIGLFIKKISDGTPLKTGLTTLPEKCVWTKDSSTIYCAVPIFIPNDIYPDSWYQGVEHFSDALYKIDAKSGTTAYIADLQGNNIDAINLMLDYNGRFLIFQNKNDGTPWSYDLKPQ